MPTESDVALVLACDQLRRVLRDDDLATVQGVTHYLRIVAKNSVGITSGPDVELHDEAEGKATLTLTNDE